MRVSTSKSEAMGFLLENGILPLPVGSALLPQVNKFNLMFTSDGKIKHKMDRWIGVAAVMRVLNQNILVK